MSARFDEFQILVRLGLPLMAAQLLQMAMGVMDTIMAGRLSPEDLAGVALATNLIWPSQFLFSGVVMAATPIISQLNGARRVGEVGEVVRQGMYLVLIASVALAAVWRNADPLYRWLHIDDVTRQISVDYLNATSWGIPGLLFYFLLRYCVEGLGKTRPAMVIAAIALVLKAGFNYVFVYGHLGAPALGGAGCGVSSAIVWWFELAAILVVIRLPMFHPAGVFERLSWPDPAVLGRYLRIGLPIGATAFAEIAAFSMIPLLMGQLGPNVVASHQIAANFNGLTFMVPLALGMAATIRVGFNIGANDLSRAATTAGVAIASSVVFAVIAGVLLLIFRHDIGAIYSTDAAVVAMSATVLLFVAAYQLADDTQVVAIGILRGCKDTRVPMVIALFGYWVVGVPVSVVMGFGWLGFGPTGIYGFWTGLTLGLAVVAVLLLTRLYGTMTNKERMASLAAS